MRRKDRKWSTLIPDKQMGFSRLLPSTLSSPVGVCGSANIASKGVPGTLKPFLRTWKRVFSTFWKKFCDRFLHIWRREKKIYIPQIRQFGSWRPGQDEIWVFWCWVQPEVHRVATIHWQTVCPKTQGFRLIETSGHRKAITYVQLGEAKEKDMA